MNKTFVISVLLILLSSVFILGNISAKEEKTFKVEQKVLDKLDNEGKVNVIVVLKDSGKPGSNKFMRTSSIENIGRDKVKNEFNSINAFSASLTEKEIAKLEVDSNVERIYYDRPLSIDLQDSVPLINATRTWKLQENGINLTGKGQTICIIDTGIDYTHPDLGNCTPTKLILNGAVENLTTAVENSHPYVSQYDNTWTITKTGYSQIAVHFVNISTEYYYDYVQIIDSNNRIIAVYSGAKQDIWSPAVSGDTISIRLKTDESVTDYGFYIDQVINGTTNTSYDWSNCTKIIGGWDIRNGDPDPKDDQGHGTHCAGIAAANGVAKGVAPDAKIIAIKALSSGSGTGTTSDVVAGIEWCINRSEEFNITVISMSIGGGNSSAYCDENDTLSSTAINNAVSRNISVVIAAGNNGWPDKISYPACIQNAIPVGNSEKDDTISADSNRNALVQLFAPGTDINSTCNGGVYCLKSGTSMATPHAAGAFAIINELLELQGNSKTPQEIESVLNATGKIIADSVSGLNFSRIDIYPAVIALDSLAPSVSLISPADEFASNLQSVNITFRCNASDLSLKNITFYLWNSTDVYNISYDSASGANKTAEFNVSNIGEGEYEWNCLAYDNNDNSAFASENYSMASDLTAPKIMVNHPLNNSWYNKGIFNISTDENSSCLYSLDDGLTNYTMDSLNDIDFYSENESLSGSSYNITYYCEDNADNVNNTVVVYFWIDATAPNVTIISPADGYSNNGTTTLSFQYNVSDNLNVSNCSIIFNGVKTDYNSSAVAMNSTNTISKSISEGTYTWSINCTDSAGNTGNSSSRSLTINAEDDDDDEGGGGGGGGGDMSSNYVVNSTQLPEGYTKSLAKGDKITFEFRGSSHSLTVNSLLNNKVNITIRSAPINLVLSAGEERKFNITSKDYYDLLVKVDGFIGAKANVTIKEIYEQITRKADNVIETESPSTATGATKEGNKTDSVVGASDNVSAGTKSNKGVIYIGIVVLIISVFAAYFLFRKLAETRMIEHAKSIKY